MKRMGNLFDRICDRANVAAAVWRAARGKRDRTEIAAFLDRADSGIDGIVEALRDGAYRFSAYREFEVRDTKRRVIHAPPYRDRVVHHAILAVAGPVLERGASPDSYACRGGYGQHACLGRARGWLRQSQRDSVPKPRVASPRATLGLPPATPSTPKGLCPDL